MVADYLGVPVEDIGAISLKVADKQLEERLALPLDKRARVHDTVLEEINQEPVTIEYIEKAIADRGWEEGWIKPQPPKTTALVPARPRSGTELAASAI